MELSNQSIEVQKKKKWTVGRSLKWGVAVYFVGTMGYAWTHPEWIAQMQADSALKAEQAKAEAPKPPTVAAAELVKAYKSNEIAADRIYKGEWYFITGFVGSIGKDILDDPYVTVGNGASFEGNTVQCMLSSKGAQVAERLSKGDTVRAYGKVDGFVILNVLVRKCELEIL